MTHPIPNLSTRSGQIAHYAAVKHRIENSRRLPTPPIKQEPTRPPTWMTGNVNFDWHVLSFKVYARMSPHVKWMRKRCVELGVTYSDMVGSRGSDRVSCIRMRMYWEMKNEFPLLSLPQIGRAFGGRDHTSVLSGIRRWEVLRHEND